MKFSKEKLNTTKLVFIIEHIKMIFEWKILFVSEQVEVGQNNLPKINFILEENTDKEFKSSIAVDLLWEKTELIKSYKVWDIIKVSLNFKANEFNWKRYNRVSAWKIEWWNWSTTQKTSSKQDEDLPF